MSQPVSTRSWLLAFALMTLGMGVLALGTKYQLTVNTTQSLPIHVAVVEKGNLRIKRDDLVAFRWVGSAPLPKGLELVKRVVGQPGDRVRIDPVNDVNFPPSCQGDLVAISPEGQEIARMPIKSFTRTGEPLKRGPVGVVPDQQYVVSGDHKDSLDSRYMEPGWIRADQIVGKVVWSW
jgi:conjugal transfer pilin signal peptidase TrbI